ncbi:MAG: type-F conjugative transfer system protein TraW [Mariprofundaceae bacterium]|nr:type-F conjugative transfer system protein TraW [Mariprofundaceae bacterium]
MMTSGIAHASLHERVIGPIYNIQEQDMLLWIQKKLQHMQKTGELQAWQQRAKIRSEKTLRRPKPVANITHTRISRKFYIDPSIVVDHVIKDHHGRIIAMPGTKVNPLSIVHMSKHLVFIDGDSTKQQTWVLGVMKHYAGKVKIILVSGSPVDLIKKWKKRVYFDQQGVLTSKFHIKHVPAIVSQDGLKLLVSEVLPRKR